MTAFYCSQEPLTEEQREGLDLVGFDIDWHLAQYLKSFGVVGIGLPPFSEFMENEMQVGIFSFCTCNKFSANAHCPVHGRHIGVR